MKITIDDVAKRAGVSTATVSRVINQTGKVSSATQNRVRLAIQELEYIPHTGARALAANRTHSIGFITPTISDIFFTDLLRGIEQASYLNNYSLLVYATQQRPLDLSTPVPFLQRHNTDGLIIFAHSLDERTLHKLQQHQIPMVLLHQSTPNALNIPSISFENEAGAAQMTTHLINCGHRRIAFLKGPEGNEDALEREAGYRETLNQHQLELDETIIVHGDFNAQIAETAVTQLLQFNQATTPIDAIFAADDESARGAITAVQNINLRIPEDIAVVGFDDSLLSQYLNPPLTTMRAPIEEAGHTAATQLIAQIETGTTNLITKLPTELIIRQSCGYS